MFTISFVVNVVDLPDSSESETSNTFLKPGCVVVSIVDDIVSVDNINNSFKNFEVKNYISNLTWAVRNILLSTKL